MLFEHLTLRDRQALLVGMIILIPTLFYFIWLEPFIESHQQLKNRILVEQANLTWMQQAAAEIQNLRAMSSTAPPVPLITLINISIARSSLNTIDKHLDSKNEQEVRIRFEEVPFTQLVQWLAQLYRQHQIQVTAISIERQQRPDTVKTQITLYRSK
jgi:general secretion pathway protein M